MHAFTCGVPFSTQQSQAYTYICHATQFSHGTIKKCNQTKAQREPRPHFGGQANKSQKTANCRQQQTRGKCLGAGSRHEVTNVVPFYMPSCKPQSQAHAQRMSATTGDTATGKINNCNEKHRGGNPLRSQSKQMQQKNKENYQVQGCMLQGLACVVRSSTRQGQAYVPCGTALKCQHQ